MNNTELEELCDKMFKLMAECWRDSNFNNSNYIELDIDNDQDNFTALRLLEEKGLVRHRGIGGSMWFLTDAGRLLAIDLFDL